MQRVILRDWVLIPVGTRPLWVAGAVFHYSVLRHQLVKERRDTLPPGCWGCQSGSHEVVGAVAFMIPVSVGACRCKALDRCNLALRVPGPRLCLKEDTWEYLEQLLSRLCPHCGQRDGRIGGVPSGCQYEKAKIGLYQLIRP